MNNVVFYILFFNQIRESFLYTCLFAVGASIVGAFGLNEAIRVNQGEKFSERFYNPAGIFVCSELLLFSVLFPQKFTWYFAILICGIVVFMYMGKLFCTKKIRIVMAVLLLCLVGMEYYAAWSGWDVGGLTVDETVEAVSGINLNVRRLLDENDLPSDEDSWRILQWNSKQLSYPMNIWSVWGYYDAMGYMNPTPNNVMNIHYYWGLDKRMQMSNIRYVVCNSKEDETFQQWLQFLGLKEIKRVDGISPYYDAKEYEECIVYENENRKGNAWLVNDYKEYSKEDNIDEWNAYINSSEFNPFETALVNTDTCSAPISESFGDVQNSSVHMTEYHANSVRFEVDAAEEALMVTSEMIAPGWEVYIDGKKGDILEVNTAFRGCIVPQGNHIVEYRYLPKAFVIGCVLAGISILTVIIICVSVFWTSRKKIMNEVGGHYESCINWIWLLGA